MDVERLGRAEPVDVPDLRHQVLSLDHPAGIAHQLGEQVELLAREIELLAAEAGDAGRGVELQLTDPNRLLVRAGAVSRGAPSQHGPYPRDHLAGAERLDHIVVGAQLEADDLVHLGAARGQHHDRHIGAPPQLAADVAAIAVGKGEVEHHQIRLRLSRQLQRARPRSG